MSAAVFAVTAVSPPVGSLVPSVYRLESLGEPMAGRPWLLRALTTQDSAAPPPLRLTSSGAMAETITVLPDRGAWFRMPVGARSSEVHLRLIDPSGSHLLTVSVQPSRAAVVPSFADERVLVVDGILVPEVEGEVIVRADEGPVEMTPVTDQVGIQPARRSVDACGLASFAVRVSGLGAPISLVTPSATGERREGIRLPLVPGGIAVRDDGDSVHLRATGPGSTAHVVAGDRTGATWWSIVRLTPDGDEGSARVPLPPGALWVAASHRGDLAEPVSPLIRPSSPPCLATPLGQRLARGRLAPPPLPPIRVLWDGPVEGEHLTGLRIHRARAVCAVGLAASVALEAALLLVAGLTRGPAALQSLTSDPRSRLGILAAGISTLLLMGAALALAVGLRSP